MNNKLKEIGEWYLELYKNDNGFTFDGYSGDWSHPSMESNLDNYKINPPKPKKKIIDLSILIGSDIDMEFGDSIAVNDLGFNVIDNLIEDNNPIGLYISKRELRGFEQCRIRQNKWMSWQGGGCPLPEGFIVVLEFNDKTTLKVDNYISLDWSRSKNNCIRAFKVIGPEEGWKYEWEKEEDNNE